MSITRSPFRVPVDADGHSMPVLFAKTVLAQTIDDSISTSTEITFNANTNGIEMTAVNDEVFVRWGTTDATSATSDVSIPAGQTRFFVQDPDSRQTAVNVISTSGGIRVYEYA